MGEHLLEYPTGCAEICSVSIIIIYPVVRYVMKDERKYYESLLQYSQEHLMVSMSEDRQLMCDVIRPCKYGVL